MNPEGATPLRLVRPLAVLLFLCSGASSLMLETLWMRLLTTTFGATTLAISTLLTVFMGGLALGGWLAGSIADRLRRESSALIVYGLLELVVAVYGLAFPTILDWVHGLHGWIWAQYSPGPGAFAFLRFLVVGMVLILPTTAMGATLPVLSRFYARRGGGLGREAGTLYSVNVFGAVTGTFLAGFVLMPALGLTATNRFACSLNLGLCVASASLGLWLRRRSAEGVTASAESRVTERPLGGAPRIALVAVAISGLVAMVYQQIWTRVLAQIIGSSVYAFALILMAFLLGLAVGGAVYSRLVAHRPGQLANLGLIHLLVAGMVLLGFFYMDRLPALFLALAQRTTVSPGSIFFLQFVMCALIVLLPTVFMGMIFPATIAVCAEGMRGVARTVGRVYAVNTLGSIAGSFLGGFVMLPLLGSQLSLAAMIFGNLALAILFTGLAPLARRPRLVRTGFMGVLIVGTLAGAQSPWEPVRMTSGVFRLAQHLRGGQDAGCPGDQDPLTRYFARGTGAKRVAEAGAQVGHRPDLWPRCPSIVGAALLHYREGLVATVSTWQTIVEGMEPTTCWESLILQVNGKVDASATGAFRKPPGRRCAEFVGKPEWIRPTWISCKDDMETQVLSGLLGTLLFPGEEPPRKALVVGWGSGVSVGVMARTGIGRVDAVELEPEVLLGAKPFERYNHDASRAGNVRTIQADGRNVLIARSESFDLIVSEPSNPWMTGAASLFTREYFELVRRRLAKDGLFIQWLQLYEISLENVLSVIATLRAVFPQVTLFHSRQAEVDLLLVASNRPLGLDAGRLRRRSMAPGVREPLVAVGIRTLGDLLARHMLPAGEVDRLVRGAPYNTDDNARIEFAAPKDLINFHRHSSSAIVDRLRRDAPPVTSLVREVPPSLAQELLDAELRLGAIDRAEALLTSVPVGPARTLRSELIGWLRDAPDWDAIVPKALQGLGRGDALVRQFREDPSEAGIVSLVQSVAVDEAPPGPRFLALGALLAPTRQKGLALVFLEAGLSLSGGGGELERVRRWVLWRLGHFDEATQGVWRGRRSDAP